MRLFLQTFLLFALCGLQSALAQPAADDLEQVFDSGAYGEVVRQVEAAAEQDPGARALAIGARAQLMIARYYTPVEEQMQAIERGLALARRALAADPDSVEGHLQTAVALGLRARRTESMADVREGRRHIRAALEREPGNPWALAALGGWHGEVVTRAGGFFAGLFFGASRTEALEYFRRALDLDPRNIPLQSGFGRMLLRLDRNDYESLAREHLKTALSIEPGNHFARLNQRLSRLILDALEARDDAELERLLKSRRPLHLELEKTP